MVSHVLICLLEGRNCSNYSSYSYHSHAVVLKLLRISFPISPQYKTRNKHTARPNISFCYWQDRYNYKNNKQSKFQWHCLIWRIYYWRSHLLIICVLYLASQRAFAAYKVCLESIRPSALLTESAKRILPRHVSCQNRVKTLDTVVFGIPRSASHTVIRWSLLTAAHTLAL